MMPPLPVYRSSHASDVPEPWVDVLALARVLCELGDVDRLRDLGTRGPLVASAGA
jgi:hypothetical protein